MEGPRMRVSSVVLSSADPRALASFYVRLLGWAVAAGATLADHQPQQHVRVMLDPAGHPFCLWQGPV